MKVGYICNCGNNNIREVENKDVIFGVKRVKHCRKCLKKKRLNKKNNQRGIKKQ